MTTLITSASGRIERIPGRLFAAPDLEALGSVAGRVRGRHLLAFDIVGVAAAGYVTLTLRYDRLVDPGTLFAFWPALAVLLPVRTISNIGLGLYSRGWRFASVPDLGRIVAAVSLGSFVAVGLFYGTSALLGVEWAAGFPRTFWVAEPLLSMAVLGSVRFAIRVASDLAPHHATGARIDPRPTLLYGAGQAGVLVVRSARREPGAGVLPVGFLDDDPALAGSSVAGVRVYGGLRALGQTVAATGARCLLITMPSASGSAIRRVVDAALALGLEVRTVPSMHDMIDGSVDAYRVRRVRVEDLLRRPMVTEHAAAVQAIIRGRPVLITGAAGSIGSELARQVHAIGPSRLILVDRAESPLYTVQRELEMRASHGGGSGDLRVHLANVVSRAAMQRLLRAEAPSVIFHAAAYKHVPLMEDDPSDAAYVNMGGTLALLDAAVAEGVERFVFVSTDKAVRPSSVMGASKRIAEMLVADTARRTGRPYVAVRFGNVLGSSGSVVPIFQDQLEKGQPLTVTDPEMTRFFMTIPEAAWLILDAAALGCTGDLFVLDMGEPIRVMDLARDLVRLSGRDPDSQPIEIMGLRPGEKLHEELFYAGEHVEPTESPKVLRAVAPPPPPGIREDVRRILALATGEDEPRLRRTLLAYARDPATALSGVSQAQEIWSGEMDAPNVEPGRQARAVVIAARQNVVSLRAVRPDGAPGPQGGAHGSGAGDGSVQPPAGGTPGAMTDLLPRHARVAAGALIDDLEVGKIGRPE